LWVGGGGGVVGWAVAVAVVGWAVALWGGRWRWRCGVGGGGGVMGWAVAVARRTPAGEGGGLERSGAGCGGACADDARHDVGRETQAIFAFLDQRRLWPARAILTPSSKNLHSTPTPSKNPRRGVLSMLFMHSAPRLGIRGGSGVLCRFWAPGRAHDHTPTLSFPSQLFALPARPVLPPCVAGVRRREAPSRPGHSDRRPARPAIATGAQPARP
jgi:hypothetical protein